GGFVLLVGGSSVGKTRSAAEAVRALLPEWWLVYPAGPDQVAALAQVPSPRTVVWLDELQDYLDGEHGLDGAVVRALLNAPDPAVIIGTLWPDRYAAYTTLPTPGGPDPGRRAAAGRPLGRRPDRQPVRLGGTHRGAGRGPARCPRPAQRRFAAGRRAGLLQQRPAGRGAGELVRAGPGLRHRQAARCRRGPQPSR